MAGLKSSPVSNDKSLRGDPLELVARKMLTKDSVELTLAFPDRRPLHAKPGQFITLETIIDDTVVRTPLFSQSSRRH